MTELSEIMEKQMDEMNLRIITLELVIERLTAEPERVTYIA